jgi:hypothetical protein
MAEDWRPRITEITDVIADSTMEFRSPDGVRGFFRVRVGRPQAFPPHDYYCPLEVEGLFAGIKPIFGTGPVDSLMNAMGLVRRYLDHRNGLNGEPLPKFD